MISAKPLPFIIPKKPFDHPRRRLPERKHMTLVAGLSGFGGLVVFSDTQETVQGYAKKQMDKIDFWTSGPSGPGLLMGGAGSAIHIEKLNQWIGPTVAGNVREGRDSDFIIKHIEEAVAEFFKEHIWIRPVNDRPELEMLLALQPNGSPATLFHIAEGVMTMVAGHFKAIGIGSYLADFLFNKLSEFGQDEAEMIAIAAYILKEVRTNIDGCGLEGAIWILRPDGTRDLFAKEEIDELEGFIDLFDEIMGIAFDAAFDTTSGRSSPSHIAALTEELNREYGKWLSSVNEQRMSKVKYYFERKDKLRGA
jgi:hypothetical protein